MWMYYLLETLDYKKTALLLASYTFKKKNTYPETCAYPKNMCI